MPFSREHRAGPGPSRRSPSLAGHGCIVPAAILQPHSSVVISSAGPACVGSSASMLPRCGSRNANITRGIASPRISPPIEGSMAALHWASELPSRPVFTPVSASILGTVAGPASHHDAAQDTHDSLRLTPELNGRSQGPPTSSQARPRTCPGWGFDRFAAVVAVRV